MDQGRDGQAEREGRCRGKVRGGVAPPPKTESEIGARLFDLAGSHDGSQNGPGWIITVIELMRAEWHCTLAQAVFRESLSAAMILWPAMLARHGAEIHFDHGDQARQEGKEAMRVWIDKHYTIDRTQLPPPGSPWRLVGANVAHP